MGIKDSGLGDDEDNLDDAERARLHASLERSLEDIRAGRVHDAMDVLAELEARRSVLRSQLEAGAKSLDAGRAIEVEEQDLDRYLSSLAPRRK
jgi:predicted transcriptional regulator